ncbi:MAG: hypothetical protein ACK4UP_13295 [Spirosomataceae bacterium]
MPTLLTGSEFNTEKGSRGILLKWLWSKLFPVINQLIPENTVQFSGNSWHYHATFAFISGANRIWELRAYASLNLSGMAYQVVGADTSPVAFPSPTVRNTHKEYVAGVLFLEGQTHFVKFFELQNGQYVQVFILKFISF